MTNITDEKIREHAYFLWQEAGSPEGQQDDFWQRARTALEKDAKSADDLVEAAGGHYPPIGDTQNFA
jgi:hypothetical protein